MTTRWQSMQKTEYMLLNRNVSISIDLVKQDAKLFCYYIGLPSYNVFLALFNYLSPLAQNMQYVLNAGRMHFCQKPGQAASPATLHYSHSRRQNV